MPADLLHQVPELAAFLAPSSLANLLACNRELRHVVHALACKVTVTRQQDLDILNKHNWPRLTIIHWLEDCHFFVLPWLENGKLEHLATMHLDHQGNDSTVLVVRAQQAPPLQHSSQSPPDSPKRRGLLDLCLYPFFAIFWTLLFWLQRHLVRLYVKLTIFVEKHTAALRRVYKPSPPASHMLAIQTKEHERGKFTRTVKESSLMLVKHGAASMAAIWPHVREIRMTYSEMDDASIAALLKGPFPELYSLHLTAISFGLQTTTALVQAAPAHLQSLCLVDCNLDNQALQVLATASWPVLSILDLSHNVFEGSAFACLAQEKWLLLTVLRLNGIDLDHDAVAELMKAEWQLLRSLTLDVSAACPDVCSLLSLAFDQDDFSSGGLLILSRHVNTDLPTNMVTWPSLHRVDFGF